MASRIGKKEWILIAIIAGVIDLTQFLCDLFLSEFFGIPEISLEIIDPIIGGLFLAYFQWRGLHMFHRTNRLLSLLCVGGIEMITGGFASLWIFDVWYLYKDVQKEEAEIIAQQEQELMLQNLTRQPLYQNGVRNPRVQVAGQEEATNTSSSGGETYTRNVNMGPLNRKGIRRAASGMTSSSLNLME